MIDVKGLVAVTGVGGVSKLIAVRPNGLIIENFDTKERKFIPVRSHEFSPFETISVYTDTDTVMLAVVLEKMKKQAVEGNEPPSEKSPSDELRDYFISVLPEHDRDRVKISDIRKIVKWFNFLTVRNLLVEKTAESITTELNEKDAEAEA